jgi:hypothetical protein
MIAVTFIGVWLTPFLHPATTNHYSSYEYQMPLYEVFTSVTGSGHILSSSLSFAMTALLLFLLVDFNTTVFFINVRTFLPALVFIVIVAIFPEYQMMNPAIPASLILMLALKRIMAGYQTKGIAYNFFDAGILISTGSLIYANLIWFGVIIIIGIVILRTVNISEIALALLGLITPYLITYGLYYVLGYAPDDFLSLIYYSLTIEQEGYIFQRLTIVTLIFEAIFVIMSIGYLIMVLNSKKIKSRKTFTLLIWVFIISVAVYFLVPSVSVEMIWISGIPVSYFLAHYFILTRKKLVSELFFTILFVLVLLIQALYVFL